ncbi:RusA family crossover junction endodeoxyribonuclease [Ornithinimicrobium flavum]|uniref:RusA family crossover junction endodeoxyribonuclease n=1 Tax=Ornithinimicrobium flavum TaxID=1288636 RepID=UPI00106FC715|nr:RusA family crossover junction endodeoxyribonuclease [Ornithinimicrobium flavum]
MSESHFVTHLREALANDHDDHRWTVAENRLRQARISYQLTLGRHDEQEPGELNSLVVESLLTAGATSFTSTLDGRSRLHATYLSKATWLAERPCTTCDFDPSGLPVSVQLPIDPFTAQTDAGALRERKSRIRSGLASMYPSNCSWPACTQVCLRVVCVLGAKNRDKDADNLVKGILDSLQSVIYENDASISHMEVFKLSTQAPRGFYLVSARPVEPLTNDVLDPTRGLSWHPSPGWIDPRGEL